MRVALLVTALLVAVPVGVFVWADAHKVQPDLAAEARHEQAVLRAAGHPNASCQVVSAGNRSGVACGWSSYASDSSSQGELVGYGIPSGP